MNISDFDYDLPDERIARFPAGERDSSKLLVWQRGEISETRFSDIGNILPPDSLLVFNDTRVVRARLVTHRPSGARVEILCLEPTDTADYEHAFAAKGCCEWSCMVGNLKKWKSGSVEIPFTYNGKEHKLSARRNNNVASGEPEATRNLPHIVRFEWDADLTFGELLELLGRMPIPPYLGRDSEVIDNTRYQTVYSRIEGSVAAPTAGLHFTPELISSLGRTGIEFERVTLHVGAGTFLPVKTENALAHPMHTEHFEVTLAAIEHLLRKMEHGRIIAVGTTSVRTLESLVALGWRIRHGGGTETGNPELARPVGQFEPYDIPANFDGQDALEILIAWMKARGLDSLKASTRIMIAPGFSFRITGGIITNFHQPKSTLLLLIAAFTGGSEWRRIYDYALAKGFRFLSYGDSSLLI